MSRMHLLKQGLTSTGENVIMVEVPQKGGACAPVRRPVVPEEVVTPLTKHPCVGLCPGLRPRRGDSRWIISKIHS